MGKRIAWWDLLIVFGITVLLIWALLKSFGIIHSPVWVEMIPYFSVIFAFIGAVYKLGKIMEGINNMKLGLDKVLDRLGIIETKVNKIENEHNLVLCGKLKIRHQ